MVIMSGVLTMVISGILTMVIMSEVLRVAIINEY